MFWHERVFSVKGRNEARQATETARQPLGDLTSLVLDESLAHRREPADHKFAVGPFAAEVWELKPVQRLLCKVRAIRSRLYATTSAPAAKLPKRSLQNYVPVSLTVAWAKAAQFAQLNECTATGK